MSPSAPPAPTRHPGPAEAWAVAALMLLAALVRIQGLGRLGLQHFDEGVYALAGLVAIVPSGREALGFELIPYAPPGFPSLVGLSYLSFGPGALAAILPSIASGVATIPVVAWLARRSFGPVAGAAAAALVALSPMHAAFSRMALTDATFLLTWLLALILGQRVLERPTVWRTTMFGLAVGLSQYFKYNGWLAGAIVALAAGLDSVRGQGESFRRPLRIGLLLALAAVIAASVYLPWYLHVEANGGYAKLLAHHRNYASGPSAWPWQWDQQLAQLVALSGGWRWGAVAWTAAVGGGWFVSRRTGSNAATVSWASLIVLVVIGAVVLGLLPTVSWWVALAVVPWWVRSDRAPVRMLAAAWILLSILTPFYRPYARLWLPLLALGWLALAWVVTRSLDAIRDSGPLPSQRSLAWVGLVALAALGQYFGHARRPAPLPDLFAPTDGQTSPNAMIGQLVGPDLTLPRNGMVRLLGRPTARFALALRGGPPFTNHPDLDAALDAAGPNDLLLIDDTILDDQSATSWGRLSRGWRFVREWAEGLRPVTRLDEAPRAAFGGDNADGSGMVFWRVYEPRPPDTDDDRKAAP